MSKSINRKGINGGIRDWPLGLKIAVPVLLLVVGYFVVDIATPGGLFAVSPEIVPPPEGEETEFKFLITDYATGEEVDDANVYLYSVDIEDMTIDEITDLEFADYELDESGDEDLTHTPENNTLYWCHINSSGYLPVWMQPWVGVNEISLMNKTEALGAVFYDADLNTEIGGDTWNTTEADWTLRTVTDFDEDEDGVDGYYEGYISYYDFSNDAFMRIIFEFEFNQSASASWVEVDDFTNVKVVAGNSTFIGLNTLLLGENVFEVDFDDGIGSDFALNGVKVHFGDIDGTPDLLVDVV
jgi:hypothetical protein